MPADGGDDGDDDDQEADDDGERDDQVHLEVLLAHHPPCVPRRLVEPGAAGEQVGGGAAAVADACGWGAVGAVGGAAHVLAWLARSADLFSSASVLSRFCSMMSTFCCLRRTEAGAGWRARARATAGAGAGEGRRERAHDTLDLIDLPLHVVDARRRRARHVCGGRLHHRRGLLAPLRPSPGRRGKGGFAKTWQVSVVLARTSPWRRARPPSARAWLNKRPAAARLPPPATRCSPRGRPAGRSPATTVRSGPHRQRPLSLRPRQAL